MNRKEKEREELSGFPCPEIDDFETSGVLLSDEIEHYATEYRMIDPFKPDQLKPAAYELTVGDEYSLGGKIERLYDESGKDTIVIQPFEVVIIWTAERINLPRFIIARWNIRVKWAYNGLLWVGGPQVDPGWVGHLPCPIYNLSNSPVELKLGDPIAVMDFVKTTPFKVGASAPYNRPPKRTVLADYEPEKLQSALFTEARQRINRVEDALNTRVAEIEKNVHRFGTRLDTSIGIIFAAIAILIAALSIFVTSSQPVQFSLPAWFYVSVILSILALIFSIFSFAKARSREKGNLKDNGNKH